jgi:hypothetical protein
MPYEESGSAMEGVTGEDDLKPAAASRQNVQKPSLLRKLSGGGAMARNNAVVRPPTTEPVNHSFCRPEPVKRDTSNQPETLETKRSIKRVVLSRDQSAVSRRLKEEQKTKGSSQSMSRLKRAELIDRKLSVEINKLGLDDYHYSALGSGGAFPPLDRMTTEDVLASWIDDDEQQPQLGSPSPPTGSPLWGGPSPPPPLGEGDRMTTIDAIAIDIANGNQSTGDDWEDTLDLMDEPIVTAPVVHNGDSGGVNADIAEKWLKGET